MTANYLTFDVEDWFHAHNLNSVTDRDRWTEYDGRVVENTTRILDLLDAHDTRATFFVLGWVADQYPDLVRDIDARGHEVASHGYNHQLLYEQSAEEVRDDLQRSLDVLEPLVDQPIRGYRAPSFSITESALGTLADLGFAYDSSSYRVAAHDRYGSIPTETGDVFEELDRGLVEAKLPVLSAGSASIPWGGGGYFRVVPYSVFHRVARRLMADQAFVFYLHPWELDPDQPRFDSLPWSYRFRHYTNLDRTEARLADLLDRFDWHPLGDRL